MLGELKGRSLQLGPGLPSRHTELEDIKSLWLAHKNDGRIPKRSDFPPELLKPWIDHVGLVEVSYRPLRLKVRLSGSKLIAYGGRDFTGMWIDECVRPEAYEAAVRPYFDCIQRREPVFSNAIYTHPGASRALMQRLYLPCSDDGFRIDAIIVAVYAKAQREQAF